MDTQITIGILTIVCMFVLIMAGMHISIALAITSFVGVLFLSGFRMNVALSLVAGSAYSAIRDYSFIVLPLFLMMGVFMSYSGAAKMLFSAFNAFLRKIPGGLGVATVLSNAVFAAVTGVSVASAAVFSKVALPEMVRYKYDKNFAVGTVSGSSILGMLIPPSALMIIYGMTAGVSIGKLFIAGVMPGILLAALFAVYIIVKATRNPEIIGRVPVKQIASETNADADMAVETAAASGEAEAQTLSKKKLILGPFPTVGLIILVMGGIWNGFFTVYEAAAVGTLGAMVISIATGMRWKGLKAVVLETAASGASILLLLISASMYSRMLSMSGLVQYLGKQILGMNLSMPVLMVLFCVIILLLGCALDSTSIVLLTVPLMIPIMIEMQMDPVWFGIIIIVTVEIGLLTPPFGMVVFAVDAAVDKSIGLTAGGIFKASVPYIFIMGLLVVLMVIFPGIVTWLPGLML